MLLPLHSVMVEGFATKNTLNLSTTQRAAVSRNLVYGNGDTSQFHHQDNDKKRLLAEVDHTEDTFIDPFTVLLQPTPYKLYEMMYHKLYEIIFDTIAGYIEEKIQQHSGYDDATVLNHIFLGHIDYIFDESVSMTIISVNNTFVSFTVGRDHYQPSIFDVDRWAEEAINTRLLPALEQTPFTYVERCTYVSNKRNNNIAGGNVRYKGNDKTTNTANDRVSVKNTVFGDNGNNGQAIVWANTGTNGSSGRTTALVVSFITFVVLFAAFFVWRRLQSLKAPHIKSASDTDLHIEADGSGTLNSRHTTLRYNNPIKRSGSLDESVETDVI